MPDVIPGFEEFQKKSMELVNGIVEEQKAVKEQLGDTVKKIEDMPADVQEKLDKMKTDLDATIKAGEEKMEAERKAFEEQLVAMKNAAAVVQGGIDQKALDQFNAKRRAFAADSGKVAQPLDAKQVMDAKAALENWIKVGSDRISAEEKTAINSIIDPQGGYLVVPQLDPEVLGKQFDAHGVLSVIDMRTNATGRLEKKIDVAEYDSADFYNELANGSITEHTPDYKDVNWNATEQIVKANFTRSELEDAFLDVENDVMMKLGEGAVRKLGAQVILGDGNGRPKGLLDVTAGTAWNQIQDITSGSSGVLKWSDVIQLLPSALKDGYHANASYAMPRSAFFALLTDTDGASQYAIMNQINFFTAEGVAMSILGKKVVWEASMPAVAANALSVIFGDFKHYRVVKRAGISLIRDDTGPQNVIVYQRQRYDGRLMLGEAFKRLKIKA